MKYYVICYSDNVFRNNIVYISTDKNKAELRLNVLEEKLKKDKEHDARIEEKINRLDTQLENLYLQDIDDEEKETKEFLLYSKMRKLARERIFDKYSEFERYTLTEMEFDD